MLLSSARLSKEAGAPKKAADATTNIAHAEAAAKNKASTTIGRGNGGSALKS
jgi:hypothetical protein